MRSSRTRRREEILVMNADIRTMKTPAELALAEAFGAARTRLPGADAIAMLRAAAFRHFEDRGLPHRRVEEWKYTDLRALMRDAKPLAHRTAEAAGRAAVVAGGPLDGAGVRRLVFVDGAFVA